MDALPEIQTREWRGWTLHECATLPSTNDYARQLVPWNAIRAKIQTSGRGRHGRVWKSGLGGLWVSIVLPLDPPEQSWTAFPLVAGLAIVSILRRLGLREARLRWPNDVLIGPRKICGILMERFANDRMVVGLGLNITNDPAAEDPALAAIATSLAKELSSPPREHEIFEELLISLRALHGRVAEEGFASLVEEINHHWGGAREVEIYLPQEVICGRFLGVDSRGDLQMETEGRTLSFSAPHVSFMREILT